VDRRDGYRSAVDLAVNDLGVKAYGWNTVLLQRARRICYRTVWTECDWFLYANVSVVGSIDFLPNDGYPSHGGDLNSVGLYQQRSQWWGDTRGSMDPYESTRRFLTRMMVNVPKWGDPTVPESFVCQWVQQSQFDGKTVDPKTGRPFPFAQNYIDRQTQTDALEADPLYWTNR
jgi:hypothetical protein